MTMAPLFTPKEASAYLGISERTLRKLAAAGAITVTAVTPGRRRYTDAALSEYVARVTRGSGAEDTEVRIGTVIPNTRTAGKR